MRLHGKRHKRDRYYFRWHYGKQRRVYMYTEYVDKPTERQKSAREAFTALRREVARQLRDAELRAAWMRRFEADNEGYKMLHTYVYAKMKQSPLQLPLQGESAELTPVVMTETDEAAETTGTTEKETQYVASLLMLYNGVIMPIFLPCMIPKRVAEKQQQRDTSCTYPQKTVPLPTRCV